MSILRKIFGDKSKTSSQISEPFSAQLDTAEDLFIIGDVHGRIDLLQKLLDKQPNDTQLVFVGDLVDRGEESAAVVNAVFDACKEGAICLMGNHERMMLDFLHDPAEKGPRWLRYGGLQTLQSYGIRGITERADAATLEAARDELRAGMSDATEDWMNTLPLQWQSGNLHVVHAAANPTVPMSEQSEKNLLWGSRAFSEVNRSDGQWVIHGHTIVDAPMIEQGRISIDTGGYATGRLTAAVIQDNTVEFVVS